MGGLFARPLVKLREVKDDQKYPFNMLQPLSGGTEKVVNAIGRDLPLPRRMINITLPQSRAVNIEFGPDEMLVLAFPVYGGRMPRFFPSLIGHLKGEDTPLVMVAVYGNRAYEGAFLDMHEGVVKNGFRPIAAIAAISEHSSSPRIAANRPDDDDQEALARFGLQTLRRAQDKAAMIVPPGAYPTWTPPPGASYFPVTDEEACTKCGHCVQVCPTGAIPEGDAQKTNQEQCLICAACVKYCQEKARILGDPATRKELSSHLDHAIIRKDATLFT